MNMIERVAHVIMPEAFDFGQDAMAIRSLALKRACAAIEAMRSQSHDEKLIHDAYWHYPDYLTHREIHDAFNAVIDAALKETD